MALSASGGIGIRSRLKICGPIGLEGSSPSSRTIKNISLGGVFYWEEGFESETRRACG